MMLNDLLCSWSSWHVPRHHGCTCTTEIVSSACLCSLKMASSHTVTVSVTVWRYPSLLLHIIYHNTLLFVSYLTHLLARSNSFAIAHSTFSSLFSLLFLNADDSVRVRVALIILSSYSIIITIIVTSASVFLCYLQRLTHLRRRAINVWMFSNWMSEWMRMSFIYSFLPD